MPRDEGQDRRTEVKARAWLGEDGGHNVVLVGVEEDWT